MTDPAHDTPSGAGGGVGAWEAWLGAWEDHLATLTGWAASPAGDPPAQPAVPQPSGRAPAVFAVRLRRAAALSTHVQAAVAAQLASTRRWTPPPTQPTGRTRIDL